MTRVVERSVVEKKSHTHQFQCRGCCCVASVSLAHDAKPHAAKIVRFSFLGDEFARWHFSILYAYDTLKKKRTVDNAGDVGHRRQTAPKHTP